MGTAVEGASCEFASSGPFGAQAQAPTALPWPANAARRRATVLFPPRRHQSHQAANEAPWPASFPCNCESRL